MLYLLFGDRGDPRLLPVALAAQGRITPITLDGGGWRKFDALYFAPGASVPVYRDGALAGQARIQRGMWSEKEPLYKLPACRSLHPLASVAVDSVASTSKSPLLELLASSAPLPLPAPRPATGDTDLDSARAVTALAAQRMGIDLAHAELELTVYAIRTGATSSPTLVGSYMERQHDNAHRVHELFVLSDSAAQGYTPSLQYVARDSAPEFRRLIDHLDLNGDGIDEIVTEVWRDDGGNALQILQYGAGKWKEVARSGTSWCGDPVPVERGAFGLPGRL